MLYVLKLGHSDFSKLFRRKNTEPANLGSLATASFGLFLGMLISYLLPFRPVSAVILAIVLLALAFLLRLKLVDAKVAAGLAILVTVQFIWMKLTGVYADDGGWMESGGTLGGWIGSPGAGQAVGTGAVPATGGAIGGMLGGIGGGMPSLPEVPEGEWEETGGTETPEEQVPEEGETPEEETPEGETPEGETSEGETPESGSGEGETPEGETPESGLVKARPLKQESLK